MIHAALMTGIPRTVESAFDEVVRQREKQVLGTAYRILGNWADAEDVAQEVFVKLHRHGMDFANDAALGGWLYRVTTNLCFDRTRTAKPVSEVPEIVSEETSPEGAVLAAERKQRLGRALLLLPERERAAVVLREIEGLDTSEVAEILGSSETTVRSQVSRALGRLREIMEREPV